MTFAPLPGMIGLTHINGPTGRLIRFGQWLNGEGFSAWEHAFVYLPDNRVLEAEPGGARVVPFNYADVYWCTGIFKLLPPTTNAKLDYFAGLLKGTPYSFADYAELATHRLHIPVPGLKSAIGDSGHMICSQLADEYYTMLGAKIFDDKRWPGYVTPASLYNRDIQLR